MTDINQEQSFQYDFEIELDYNKEATRPSRVFDTMASLIDAFEYIDKELVKTIDANITSSTVLELVNEGSVKSFLRNVLESVDDNALKEFDWKRIVGAYLLKAKYRLLEYMKDNDEIDSQEEVKKLQKRYS